MCGCCSLFWKNLFSFFETKPSSDLRFSPGQLRISVFGSRAIAPKISKTNKMTQDLQAALLPSCENFRVVASLSWQQKTYVEKQTIQKHRNVTAENFCRWKKGFIFPRTDHFRLTRKLAAYFPGKSTREASEWHFVTAFMFLMTTSTLLLRWRDKTRPGVGPNWSQDFPPPEGTTTVNI